MADDEKNDIGGVDENDPMIEDDKGEKRVRILDIVGQDIIDKRFDATWRIGGSDFDKRFLKFVSQVFVSVGVISFCMVQLVRNNDCESQQEYISLLTLIVGIFLPEPSFKRE